MGIDEFRYVFQIFMLCTNVYIFFMHYRNRYYDSHANHVITLDKFHMKNTDENFNLLNVLLVID